MQLESPGLPGDSEDWMQSLRMRSAVSCRVEMSGRSIDRSLRVRRVELGLRRDVSAVPTTGSAAATATTAAEAETTVQAAAG
jgi:hypothetical protein